MKIQVINIKGYENDDYIYVGRPSKYGNPFSSKKDSLGQYVGSKEVAIEKFTEYIDQNEELIDQLISELIEKNVDKIGCWCHPSKCHGDVLKERIEMRNYKSII